MLLAINATSPGVNPNFSWILPLLYAQLSDALHRKTNKMQKSSHSTLAPNPTMGLARVSHEKYPTLTVSAGKHRHCVKSFSDRRQLQQLSRNDVAMAAQCLLVGERVGPPSACSSLSLACYLGRAGMRKVLRQLTGDVINVLRIYVQPFA